MAQAGPAETVPGFRPTNLAAHFERIDVIIIGETVL
jgi:hypothetical protein